MTLGLRLTHGEYGSMSIDLYDDSERRWAQVAACHFPHILRELLDEHFVICVITLAEWFTNRGEILARWRSYEYALVVPASQDSPDYPPMSSTVADSDYPLDYLAFPSLLDLLPTTPPNSDDATTPPNSDDEVPPSSPPAPHLPPPVGPEPDLTCSEPE